MFKTFRLATCASLLSLSPVLMAQASAAELKVVASFSMPSIRVCGFGT